SAAPGSAENLYLVVDDIDAARADLADRGVEVSEVFPDGALGDRFHPDARVDEPARERATCGSLATFSDPDRNSWLLQKITTRLPGGCTTERRRRRGQCASPAVRWPQASRAAAAWRTTWRRSAASPRSTTASTSGLLMPQSAAVWMSRAKRTG